jgi:hypothetical protein
MTADQQIEDIDRLGVRFGGLGEQMLEAVEMRGRAQLLEAAGDMLCEMPADGLLHEAELRGNRTSGGAGGQQIVDTCVVGMGADRAPRRAATPTAGAGALAAVRARA